MGKLIITTILVFITLTSQAQVFLGYSEKEIRGSIQPNEKATTVTENGYKTVIVTFSDVETQFVKRYVIDPQTDVCLEYVVEPVNKDAVETFNKTCDSSYKKVSASSWLLNLDGLKVKVKRDTLQGKILFFFGPA